MFMLNLLLFLLFGGTTVVKLMSTTLNHEGFAIRAWRRVAKTAVMNSTIETLDPVQFGLTQ